MTQSSRCKPPPALRAAEIDLFEQIAKFFSNFGGGIAGEGDSDEPFRVTKGAALQGERGRTAVKDRPSRLQRRVGRHKIR
jgi:hypothetical protein